MGEIMRWAAAVSALAAILCLAAACEEQGVGDPCVPEQEGDAAFVGFDEHEVNVESKSLQCRTRLCLVNHFRGRVTRSENERAQCSHRPATDAVYCSCRCANVDGRTDDGPRYCACPEG